MAELPLDKVLGFLKKVRPFTDLPESALRDVAKTLLIDYFPKGETVLSPGLEEPFYLYLVFSGVGRCYAQNGQTTRYVSEKDHFGSEAILTGQCRESVQVEEDMICYLVRSDTFRQLEGQFDGFRQYFRTTTDTLTAQIWDWMESQAAAPPLSWQEKTRSSQFRTSIDALIGRDPVCCTAETSASEIARTMTVNGVGSVIIADGEKPLGIVTKNDLTEKILARQRSGDVPASEIMSRDLLTMDLAGSCFDASLKMLEKRCRHMVAMKNGVLYGVISQHDLILLQGANPLAVIGAIDRKEDVEGLKKSVSHMSIVQQAVIADGGRIEDIWALMTGFRDTLTRRLIVLAIEQLRKEGKEPPVLEFCWITFGTPGRKETLLRKNFLEGFMYKDPDAEHEETTRVYFKELTKLVKEGLLQCQLIHDHYGMVLCSPESAWRRRMMSIVEGQTTLNPDRLRMFDFRGVLERGNMISDFRKSIFKDARKNTSFIGQMKKKINPHAMPCCFYGDAVVSGMGRKETVPLKKEVIIPLSDAVRALAMENGVHAYSTTGRIRDLWDIGVLSAQKARDLQTAYEWLVEMSLFRTLESEDGEDWELDPKNCSSDEKRLLTDCFRSINNFMTSHTGDGIPH